MNIDKILENIAELKKLCLDDKSRLEVKITREEVCNTLKQTCINVDPGPGGFGGAFYKVFWKFLKNVVIGSINDIYENGELPLSLRLEIVALIPKSDKDQLFI